MAKYNLKADKFTADGNDLFHEKNFCESLLAYNLSLCYAETGTEAVALAFGNRSAVYFCIEEYELCIQNIKLARTHNYPVEKIQKLDQRQTNAERLLVEKGPKPEDVRAKFFKMRYPPNPKHPSLADCIALKEDPKYGKYLITTKDMKPGDVIALIEPTFAEFDKRARLHHCTNCQKNSMKLSLIPCTKCSKAMYCSEECRDTHREKFHQFECPVANTGIENDLMCMLCKLLFHFDWNVDSMKQFFDEHEGHETVFDFDLSDTSDQCKSLLVAVMKTKLRTKDLNSSTLPEFFEYQERFIQKHPKLQSIFASERNKHFLDSLAPKFFWIYATMRTTLFQTNIDMTLKEEVAADDLPTLLACPFILMPNNFLNMAFKFTNPYEHLLLHSCVPSVEISTYNDKAVWTVLSPLSAGGRITINYQAPYHHSSKLKRQEYLNEFYNFQCECVACLHDWKFLKEKKSVSHLIDPIKYEQFLSYFSSNVCNSPKDVHARIALEAIDTIPLLHAHLPNKEYFLYTLALRMSFSLMALPELFLISAPPK